MSSAFVHGSLERNGKGTQVPAWSDEIAGVVVSSAAARAIELNQMQVQKLVYIAHGWQLASTGEPLTGDRPEATAHGPEYRRLADRTAPFGLSALRADLFPRLSSSILDEDELDLIARVVDTFGKFESDRLAAITRDLQGPWAKSMPSGLGREIRHDQVRQHFEALNGKRERVDR